MKETAEVLLKRTRSELAEIAEKLGIKTTGVAKTKIAESIVESRKRAGAKEVSKPMLEAPRVETSKGEVTAKEKLKPHIGKNGVFAKRAAIDAQIKKNEEAVIVIGTGVKEVQAGIKDMQSAMDSKAREMLQEGAAQLQKSVKEMHKGVKEMQSAIDNKADELQNGVKEMYSGVRVIQKGIRETESRFREYQNETANYIKDFYYA